MNYLIKILYLQILYAVTVTSFSQFWYIIICDIIINIYDNIL